MSSSSAAKSTATRVAKTPLDHLKSKKWCFPPSTTASAASGQSSPRLLSPSKSPEPNCAICLGKIEDKSFTDRCFHCFCRLCLFEWSKVKAECPVCRQAFEKIIYNIRAMDDYDEQLIQTGHRHRFGHFHSPFGYHPFANLDGNQRFRYPTTLTPLRRRMMDFERRIQLQLQMTEFTPGFQSFPQFLHMIDNRRVRDQRLRSSAISNAINNNNNSLRNSSANQYSPSSSRTTGQGLALNERHRFRGEDPMISGQSSRTWNPNNYYANPFELDMYPPPAGTTAHRRYIYDSDLWVLTNGDGNTSRTREVTARFFSSNPACTHRLIPWLNRELNSILDNTNETETLIPRIMNALLMYDITSIGFKKIIAPFTHHKTNHFIHEFYNFARSPYDMEQYTRNAVYVPRHRADIVESEPLPGPIGYAVEADDSPPHLSPRYVLQSPESISSSSSDSSIEVIDEPFSRSTNRRRLGCPGPQRMLTSPDIFSIDGSDSDESSTEIRQLITPSPVNTPSLHESRDQSEAPDTKAVSAVSNPTPLPRGDLPDVNFRNIDIIDDFDNPKPGTSGLSRMRTTAQTKWSDSDTDVDVGDELEAAIARFEQNCKPEVKTETIVEKTTNVSNNNGNDSDSSCSSVLIVGYVKPLHERTPEFVNLISTDEQIDDSIEGKANSKAKKLKKSRKLKHRKRSSGRSRSGSQSRTPVPSASHSKRKHRHKSRSRDEEKDRSRHRHRSHRMSRHYRTDTSSSSSDSSSNSDELKQLTKSFRKREHKYRTHRKHSSDSKRFRWSPSRESRYFEANRDTTAATSTTSTAIPVPSLTSSSRPSSLGSVVIRKQPLEWPPLRHYSVYSDSD